MDKQVDEIDKHIIYHLTRDARHTSAPAIAEEVDVSAATIRNRISQLEEKDVIRGYHADVDYERAEGQITNLFMCNAPVSQRESLAQQVRTISGVVNVRELMAGHGNLHVLAVGTDTADMTRVARDLSNLGLEIEDEALLQREHSTPYRPYGPTGERDRLRVADLTSLTGGAEVVELTVSADAPITSRTLAEANELGILSDDVLVVAIERGDRIVTPKGNTEVRAGDVVSVFARDGVGEDVATAFTDEVAADVTE